MEYEYTEERFKKASDAVIAFESGIELFTTGCLCHEDINFCRVNIVGACANLDNLYTRKEKEKAIDFEKEFLIDTPWMFNDDGVHEYFAYALMYDAKTKSLYKFRAFDDQCTATDATNIVDWQFARHLTKEEEIEYLGAK